MTSTYRRSWKSDVRRTPRATRTIAAALALPLLLAPTGAQGAPASDSVVTTDDAYTTSTRPEYNAGERHKVAVGLDRTAEKVGYFKFEVPSGELHSPYLLLTISGGTPGTVHVHTTGPDWSDRSITPGNAPDVGSEVGAATVTGRKQTLRVPLDDLPSGSSGSVSLAVTRTDGGITRIVSQERPGGGSARLGFKRQGEGGAASPNPRPERTPPGEGNRPPAEQGETSTLPIYVSPTTDTGNRFESFEARMEEGWATALYVYWPGEMRWNAQWEAFVARHPEGIPVVASPKRMDPTHVRTFLDQLPQAWRDKFTMAYYQEPEDNFTTSAERAEFRQRIAEMADLVRPYGVANAVHLQEWMLSPYNNKSWGGERALTEFFNPEDIDRLSWSLYRPGVESMREGVDRIKAFSERYAPGIPWGVTAAGVPVPPASPIGGAVRAERAEIVVETAEYIASVGGQSFGWFDHDGYLPGQDLLASKDPALTEALKAVTEVERTGW